MIRAALLCAALSLATAGKVAAQPAPSPPSAAAASSGAAIDGCLAAITGYETRYGIPAGLLLAIARTESGRPDPRTGIVQPWPWTVDVGGTGVFLASQAEAVEQVAAARQRGVASIDTGCLQVNLQQHPDAFKTLDEAFAPSTNVGYAARFLLRLHDETGDWIRASCFYHSHTPELAISYLRKVQMHLGGAIAAIPAMDAKADAKATTMTALQAAWGATLSPVSQSGTAQPGAKPAAAWLQSPHAPAPAKPRPAAPSVRSIAGTSLAGAPAARGCV